MKRPELEKLYPKYTDFLKLRAQLDPKSRFMNEYLAEIFN